MHLDWIVSDLLSDLRLTPGAVILFAAGLTPFYFVVKWAVRSGVHEALHWEKKEHGESKDSDDGVGSGRLCVEAEDEDTADKEVSQ